jgi:hypothetical protein
MANRKQIELYNFDKYQPHLPNPSVDRIDGNADEMVLSADGYEQSASGGQPGSLTLNANGGVWSDTGPGVTCEVSSRTVTTTDTTSSGKATFLTFNKSAFRTADIQAIIQSGNNYIKQPIEVIHSGSDVSIHTGTATAAPVSHGLTIVYTAEISSGDVTLKIAGVPSNTTITCVIRYTLV